MLKYKGYMGRSNEQELKQLESELYELTINNILVNYKNTESHILVVDLLTQWSLNKSKNYMSTDDLIPVIRGLLNKARTYIKEIEKDVKVLEKAKLTEDYLKEKDLEQRTIKELIYKNAVYSGINKELKEHNAEVLVKLESIREEYKKAEEDEAKRKKAAKKAKKKAKKTKKAFKLYNKQGKGE